MLNNWFSNNDTKLINFYQNLDENALGLKVNFLDSIQHVQKNDIIIFSDHAEFFKSVIRELYAHDYPFQFVNIFDIGLIQKLNPSELQSAIAKLFESGAKIICLQHAPYLEKAIFQYLNNLETPYEAMQIASKTIDPNEWPLSKCKRFIEFGVQGHLCNINKRFNDVLRIRLGGIKSDIIENEPYCRHQDYVILDCNAIKHQDFPGHENCGPAGLTSEELTMIFRYLGFSNRLKAITIKGYNSIQDFNHQGAKLIAQCIWYYMNGSNDCLKEGVHQEDHTEYIVDLLDSEEPLTFLQGSKSKRWWIKDTEHNSLIPCSYNDYVTACNNEIPNRLFL